MVYNHGRIKLELERYLKIPNIWKLKHILLGIHESKKKFLKLRKYFELNENISCS